MEVTESLLDRVPVGNLRVPRAEFSSLWIEAERLNGEAMGRPSLDWYPAAVAVTCRWLAGAVVQDQTGRRALAPAPATRRRARAYEELIEAEFLAAEQLDVRRPDLVGAENWVTSCDLQVLVDEAAEPVPAEHADGRPGTLRDGACGRALVQ